MEDTLEMAGICPIKEYIQLHQATIVAHIAFWNIYELCTGVEKIPGYCLFIRWWYQYVGRDVE